MMNNESLYNIDMDDYWNSFNKYGLTSVAVHALFLTEWKKPNRVYHGMVHLNDMLHSILTDKLDNTITEDQFDLFVTAALVHDVIYVPGAKDNEDKSIEFFLDKVDPSTSKSKIDAVVKLVEATKYKRNEIDLDDQNVQWFLHYDLEVLCSMNVGDMMDKEELIFKEFQFVDYSDYRIGRTKILTELQPLIKEISPLSMIDHYIDCINRKKRNLAIFPGTFNPFHTGHANIVTKAEQIFDKVIIAPGINPDKSGNLLFVGDIRSLCPHNQIEPYTGFLHDFVNSKTDEYTSITVIKGMGRHYDFDDHKTQQRFIEDMDKNIKFAYIIPDREFDHISSSAIRSISKISEMKNKNDDLSVLNPDYTSKYLK